MANKGYEIIFPTKTFYVKKLSYKEICDAIVLKDNKDKYILWFKGQRIGRMYYGNCKQLDFEIKKIH